MAVTLGRFGPKKALALFADWTDRIAAGELPFAKPERPQGLERNVVISMWEWSTPKAYLHDAVSSDKRDPRVNANGPIYGSPEESTDMVPVLDPSRTSARTRSSIRYRDPQTPSSTALPRGRSPYWGDEPIWDGHTEHSQPDDRRERARVVHGADPAAAESGVLQAGLGSSVGKVAPLDVSARQLSMYDPKTSKWSLIDTCFTTQHLYFAKDADNTLWTSAGNPGSGVVGWLNTKMYERDRRRGEVAGMDAAHHRRQRQRQTRRVRRGQPAARSREGQARHGGVLRRAAESGRRFHLGPGDGRRLFASRSARIHPQAGAGPESVGDRADRNLPAA